MGWGEIRRRHCGGAVCREGEEEGESESWEARRDELVVAAANVGRVRTGGENQGQPTARD